MNLIIVYLVYSPCVDLKKHITTPQVLKSKLYFHILKVFKENGIELPFPQRDVHINSKERNYQLVFLRE